MAQAINAANRERLTEIRKTGTDAADAKPNITPVRTGFEGQSKMQQKAPPPARRSRKSRDLADAARALGFGTGLTSKPQKRRRASDDLLRGIGTQSTVTENGDEDNGTDAGESATDVFRLIAGANRHE